MNAVTCFQLQLMYLTISNYLSSNMLIGGSSWGVQKYLQHNEKNKAKEEYAKANVRWRYIESYLFTCKPSWKLPKETFRSTVILLQLEMVGESIDRGESLYLHCKPVYRVKVQRVINTAVIVMILRIALKQTRRNLKMMVNCF